MPVKPADVYGGFLRAIQAEQAYRQNEQAMEINANTDRRAEREAGQIFTLRDLQIQDAQRKNAIAASTQPQAMQAAQEAANAGVIKAADDYAQTMLDLGVPGQKIADKLISQGILPEGTISLKVPAPWDPSGRQQLTAFAAPGQAPVIFNEDVMRKRYEADIISTAGAREKMLGEQGLILGTNERGQPAVTQAEGWPAAPLFDGMKNMPEFAKIQYMRDVARANGDFEKEHELNLQLGKLNEDSFDEAVAADNVKVVREGRTSAEAARTSLENWQEAVKLINSGIITGTGSEYIVSLGKALRTAGINYKTDAAENTQAFIALAAKRTADILATGAMGAGTGISDKDFERMNEIAAGRVDLNEGAIRFVMNTAIRVNQNIIKSYKEHIRQIKPSMRSKFIFDPDVPVPPELMSLNADAALPEGIPEGSKQIGTSKGKPVYETPDGKRLIVK